MAFCAFWTRRIITCFSIISCSFYPMDDVSLDWLNQVTIGDTDFVSDYILQVNFFSFYNFFKKVFGNDGELKIVIFHPNTKLGILFVISGQTALFFNQFVNFKF